MASDAPTPLGTVLVTGGCGFLGGHIVSRLLEYSSPPPSIHVLDLSTRNEQKGATYHTADLTSPASVRELLEKVRPDVVIHTASPIFTSGTKKSLEIMRKVNVDGTKNMVNESKKAGVKAFVHTSSASVVSDCRTDLINADERWLIIRGGMQREYYAETKAEAEEWVLEQNAPPTNSKSKEAKGDEEGHLLITAIRPAGLFGERDAQTIPGMLGAYHRGQTGWQFGENENLFDWTYVGNVAHAHVIAAARLLETWDAYTKDGVSEKVKMINVGGGAMPQEVEDRVDGQAFLINNASPIYFWDFARAVWFAYHRHLINSPAKPSQGYPPPLPAAPPKPFPRILPFPLMLTLASIAGWIYWALGLGIPKMDAARVRYSCMTRYYNTAKAQAVLGYEPVFELSEAVERTTAWWMESVRRGESKVVGFK